MTEDTIRAKGSKDPGAGNAGNENEERPRLEHALRVMLSRQIRAAAPQRGPHPEAEVLADFYERKLPPDRARDVESHILLCRSCAALMTDLQGLVEGAGYGAQVALGGEESRALWQRISEQVHQGLDTPALELHETDRLRRQVAELEARVLEFEARPRPAAPASSDGSRSLGGFPVSSKSLTWGQRARRWSTAVAATLLLATGLLTMRVVQLQETVTQLAGPVANVPLLDDLGRSLRRGAGEGEVTYPLPAGNAPVLLILPLPVTAGQGPFGLRMTASKEDGGGGEVLTLDGLVPNATGSLTLLVPRRDLAAGVYEVRVFKQEQPGADAGSPASAEYRLTLVETPTVEIP